jgi:hypothetical protein
VSALRRLYANGYYTAPLSVWHVQRQITNFPQMRTCLRLGAGGARAEGAGVVCVVAGREGEVRGEHELVRGVEGWREGGVAREREVDLGDVRVVVEVARARREE